jgi:hypothetical protein
VVIEAVETKERSQRVANLDIQSRALPCHRGKRRFEDVEQVQVAAGTDLVETATVRLIEAAQGHEPRERFREKRSRHVERQRHGA